MRLGAHAYPQPALYPRALRQGQIRRSSQTPALGFGQVRGRGWESRDPCILLVLKALLFPQLNSLQPPALIMGIPLVDPKELVPTQGEPDRTYESSSHTLMAK